MTSDSHIPYEALARYLSKKSEKDERESVERHLKDCEFCRKDLEDAKAWQAQLPVPKARVGAAFLVIAGIAICLAIGAILYVMYLR